MKLLTTFLLASAALLHAEVKVTVDSIDDRRTTSNFPGGLEINLKLAGPELADCKGLRVAITAATDDTGRDLQAKDKSSFMSEDRDFKPLSDGFGSAPKNKGEGVHRLSLQNPARAAKVAKVTGNLEILKPAADPKSVITVKLATEAGKPLAHEALKAAGCELTFDPVKGKEGSYKITDPNSKIGAIEFCSADGVPLKTRGWSSSGFGGTHSKSVNFESEAPAGIIAKVYLLTDKSVTKVPLKFDATLP